MLAYSSSDLILEPFTGLVFELTPGQSTQLAGLQQLYFRDIEEVAARYRILPQHPDKLDACFQVRIVGSRGGNRLPLNVAARRIRLHIDAEQVDGI